MTSGLILRQAPLLLQASTARAKPPLADQSVASGSGFAR